MADKVEEMYKLHKRLQSEGHSTSTVSNFVSIFQTVYTTMPVNLSGLSLPRGSIVPRPLADFIAQPLIQFAMSVLETAVKLESELLACCSTWCEADPCDWGDTCRRKTTHGRLHCSTTVL